MPISRRVIKIGGGRYVALPPAWLEYYENKSGKPIETVLMELNNAITITIEESKNESKEPNPVEQIGA